MVSGRFASFQRFVDRQRLSAGGRHRRHKDAPAMFENIIFEAFRPDSIPPGQLGQLLNGLASERLRLPGGSAFRRGSVPWDRCLRFGAAVSAPPTVLDQFALCLCIVFGAFNRRSSFGQRIQPRRISSRRQLSQPTRKSTIVWTL